MRAITKRGYNNKKVKKVADLKTGEEKADYLIDKWSRTVTIDFKGFPLYRSRFIVPKPCNRIPIYFATSLPTIKNADALTEDDLISGYSGLSNHTPKALTEGQKNEVKNAFRRSGLLQPENFENAHSWEEDPLHAPNAPFYLAPGEENKFKWEPGTEPEQYLYDLLAFCICDAPDEKYFELYYYKDQWGFLRPYERFNYDAWVKDNFPGKTINDVAQKCTEILQKYGATTGYKLGSPVWYLDNNFNLKQAEQDIKDWKSQCRN